KRAVLDTLWRNELLRLTWLPSSSLSNLERAFQEKRWDIFHFIGIVELDQERGEAFIVAEDPLRPGAADRLAASRLGGLLSSPGAPSLVVLDTYEQARGASARLAASLVKAGVPAVIAMSLPISDNARVAFNSSFYSSLADGRTISQAVTDARIELARAGFAG